MKICTIGTRSSELAKAQALPIHDHLVRLGYQIKWKLFTTSGDMWQHGPLNPSRGDNFFTKEIDEALISKEIDIAVHSLKDVAVSRPRELIFACIPKRLDPSDWLIHRVPFDKIIKIATSSNRRERFLRSLWPHMQFTWIRGNIQTRIEKLKVGKTNDEAFEGTVLAAAGLLRLNINFEGLGVTPIPFESCLPAPGQGAIVAEIRKQDDQLGTDLSMMSDSLTHECVTIERLLLKRLGGGCQMPLGVLVEKNAHNIFSCRSMFAYDDRVVRSAVTGTNIDEIITKTFDELRA